jgi:hypothetical protein
MGRVVFNGRVATTESQVYIRRAEQAILAQKGKDEWQLAREVENLYRENGLEPGTFFAGGSLDVSADERNHAFTGESDMGRYSGGGFLAGLIRDALRWLGGFVLLLIALALMKFWGMG